MLSEYILHKQQPTTHKRQRSQGLGGREENLI